MSQRPSGYERIDADAYYTPDWVTEALCGVELFVPSRDIWDPACGDGGMCRVLEQHTDSFVDGTDIKGPGEIDFLESKRGKLGYPICDDNIVTNPPYRLAQKFIEKALDITCGKVAMLLRVDFDSANSRRHLFKDNPAFARKWVLTKRIRWTNIPQTSSPSQNHAWFVWDHNHTGKPTIGYLP